MELFKNKVGRPSNKIIRKRRIIKISLLVVCIALIMTILLKTNILSRLKGEASNGNYTLSVEKFVNLENEIDFSYETSYGYVVAEKISDKEYKLTKYDQNLEQLGDSKTLSGISIDESTIKTSDDGFASYYDGKINIFDNNFDLNQSFVVDGVDNMLQSNDGNYLIVSENYIDDKNTQIMIKKYNLNGEVLLNKIYDVNDENGVDDFAIILKEDNDSSIVIGIRYYTNNGEFITKILKYDVNGNILIDKVINDSNLSNKDALMNIDIDSNGNYLLIFNRENEIHSNIVCINKNTGEIINNNSFDSVFIKSNSKKNSNNHVFSGATINDGFVRNSVLETDSNNNIVFNLIDKDNDGGLANVYYQNANKYILIGNTISGETGFLAVYNVNDNNENTEIFDNYNYRFNIKYNKVSGFEKIYSKIEIDNEYALIGKIKNELGVYAKKYNNDKGNSVFSKKLLVDNETEINCEECKAFKINNEIGILSNNKLHFYDNDFNFIETKNLDGNYEKITLTNDGNYLLLGSGKISKYDNNKIHEFTINIEDKPVSFVFENLNGNIVISGNYLTEEYINDDEKIIFYGYIEEYDSSGKLLNSKVFDSSLLGPIVQMKDGNYITTVLKSDFSKYITEQYDDYQNKVVTINNNFEIIKEKQINMFSLFSGFDKNDKGIIFSGVKGLDDLEKTNLVLLKVDNNGDIVWLDLDENFDSGNIEFQLENNIKTSIDNNDKIILSFYKNDKEYYNNNYMTKYYIDGYNKSYNKGEKVQLEYDKSKLIKSLKIFSKYNNKDVTNEIIYNSDDKTIVMPEYDIIVEFVYNDDNVISSTTKISNNDEENAKTYDNIIVYFILGGISFVLFIFGVTIYVKKKK